MQAFISVLLQMFLGISHRWRPICLFRKDIFCTTTIVEGVNTDAQNMSILSASKGSKKLTPFDIKNIKGRAGRYYHCFVVRVFYMSKELSEIENSDSLSLDFITYSDNGLSVIGIDNADVDDLTVTNKHRKELRESETRTFLLPQDVFLTEQYQKKTKKSSFVS